jgi:hypothetical protein
MLDVGFIMLLSVLAAGTGLWLLDRLGGRPDTLADSLALALPLGLGTFALATLALGELGLLSRGCLAALLACGFALGWAALPWHPRRSDDVGPCFRWCGIDAALVLLLAVTLLGSLLTALAPVTDGDALCYHLQVPKVFLARGAVCFEPDLHETVYPLVTELLYAIALAFRGPVACRLLSWVLGVVFASGVTALARPYMGARAWWAGVVALLAPAVSNGMSAPLNDVALAAFGTAAIAGWTRFCEEPSFRRAALAGILAGLALGVKYPALVLAGLLAPAMLGTALRKEAPGRAIRSSIVFAVVVLVVGGPWYLRAYWYTGNPVYPFFRQFFGGAGLDEVLDPVKRPLAVNVPSLLTALGPLTLEPDRFDSFAHQFGPVFLLFLPALLLERPPRRLLGIVLLGFAFLTLCLTQRQSMRFVLIAVGPMAVGVAWVAHLWWQRRMLPGRILVGALVLVLGFEASLAVARARHGLPVVVGREDSADYLARREPTFQVGCWVAANLPETARIIGQDHRGYYLPRPYTMELAHRRRTGLGRSAESATMIVARLKQAGFTHLLLCPPVPETAVEFDPTLGRLLGPWLAERTPLYAEDLGDADGVVRRYSIYALETGPASGRVAR